MQIKEKEAGFGPFFKKKILSAAFYAGLNTAYLMQDQRGKFQRVKDQLRKVSTNCAS